MSTLINLTPHAINLLNEDNVCVGEIPASGSVARTQMVWEYVREINGITVGRNAYGAVEGLPEPKEDTFYIVSLQVAMALRDRKDLLVPGPSVREGSVIIGCKGLCCL